MHEFLLGTILEIAGEGTNACEDGCNGMQSLIMAGEPVSALGIKLTAHL